jgi:putative protease
MKKTTPKIQKIVKKTKKIVVKKNTTRPSKKEGKLIGKVSHYFSDISVAVIKLSVPLAVGDEIRIMGGNTTDFNQKAKSLQMDHREVKKAKKGNSIGLKVAQKVREGYNVYKV